MLWSSSMANTGNGNGFAKWVTILISLFVLCSGAGTLAWTVLREETKDNRECIAKLKDSVHRNATDVAVIIKTVERIDKNVDTLLERD